MECFEFSIINHYVLNKQYLNTNAAPDDLNQLIKDVGGLQATSNTTPYLSLFARKEEFKQDQLEKALYDQPTLAGIRCVRKQMFILPADQIPSMYQATADKLIKASRNLLYQQGVSIALYTQLSAEIIELLAEKSMTARQIEEELPADTEILATLNMMCDEGMLVRGRPVNGWMDKNIEYSLFGDVFPDLDLQSISEKEAISQVVHFYLRSYGPATETDIAWWTGLGKIRIRAALRTLGDQVSRLKACGSNQRFLILSEELPDLRQTTITEDSGIVYFLPSLDPYFMGYADQDRYMGNQVYDRVFDHSGNVTNTILVNSDIKGVWDFEDGEPPVVKLHLFDYYMPISGDKMVAQAKALGQFLFGKEPNIIQCSSMPNLEEAPAGSFLAPLKDCP